MTTFKPTCLPRLGLAMALGLALLLGLLWATAAARPPQAESALQAQPGACQYGAPDEWPVVTNTDDQHRASVSGDCVVFRQDDGIYLHNLTSGETFTVTDQADVIRKVVVSQGVVVWRSDREGERGLWGYYQPACSDAGPFTSTQPIGPFYIVSRGTTQAPALSGEIVTFDAWAPKGDWYVAAVELDANDNGVPDAAEPGYDPANDSLLVPISNPNWSVGNQRMSDVHWDDDYRIACWYDNTGGVEGIQCNNLHHLDHPTPWIYAFTVVTSTWIPMLDFQGIVAVHRDLVIWTDGRNYATHGHDLYLADLDLDDDGILNHDDATPGEGQAVLKLVGHPWDQAYPDIWQPFVVWSDWRNGSQADVYAYDLSLDSDGDGVVNWKDNDRHCIDHAEFRITFDPAQQTLPEVWSNTVIWEDARSGNWDIYGAFLTQRAPVPTASGERALYWLDQQTMCFTPIRAIPGYSTTTGLVTRYKSFSQSGVERLRRVWHSPIEGAYVVGYDYCRYGAPDEKQYLGRYGRGFTYDQGLALIAHAMSGQFTQTRDLASHVSSFQNSGQLTTTTPGSFGFSFNGQGDGGEKDNFYDMDYLRSGVNAWLGYGLLFYARQSGDAQFTDVITRLANYLLDQQVVDPADARYGLFTGGQGSWITQTDQFTDMHIGWVAAEHNIDLYFFLRDLALMTGNSRYRDAALLLRANMPALWNEAKGRLNQGMLADGALNTGDALDAASWGAMYWVAVGDLEKAARSLEYADLAYSNTVALVSPTLSIWGYKPYTGTAEGEDWSAVNMVWSEGSLGVALAHLKLGRALQARGDAAGQAHLQKAARILAEMVELQALDPNGGLMYTLSPGSEIAGFPQAPSVAGAAWLLMAQSCQADEMLCDAFWGRDKTLVYLPLIFR